MRALLDTHALLWWLSDEPSLTRTARKIIADTENTLIVSAASAWEIATKVGLNKLAERAKVWIFTRSNGQIPNCWKFSQHGIRAGLLPGPHRDPFDRMLIAQSQAENIPIVSNETAFDSYGVRRLW